MRNLTGKQAVNSLGVRSDEQWKSDVKAIVMRHNLCGLRISSKIELEAHKMNDAVGGSWSRIPLCESERGEPRESKHLE